MQAVLNSSAAIERLHFASGRDYMMRSEKRPDPIRRASEPGKKPPRRRRKRAGFFYMLLMTLLLLTLWPLGLLMLWRRKVRWGVLTKLLTSIVTLAACIILIGFALTVNTGNAQYTAVQDSVNSFLDSAADTLVDTGIIVSERAAEMAYDMEDVASALWEKNSVYIANGIDAGIALTQRAKTGVLELVEKLQASPAPETDAENPTPETSPSARSSASSEPSATPGTSASATQQPSAQATASPVETAAAVSSAPSAEAEGDAALSLDTVPVESADAETDESALQTSPEAPTAAPTAQLISPSATLKPAAQATVYHSMDGKWYHTFNRCSGMTGGGAYTLEECADTHKQCRACGAPDAALIGQDCLWMDALKICHTSDECGAFEGKYTLILRDEALEQGLTGCEECGGSEYLIPSSILESALADSDVPAADGSAE